ncbi:putative uncharacterized protein MSANTD5 [Sciurus carolinensis]|uniref:putative uncharacterized protein MSANTD5 n=1 Tax=Sciurus carolinensis TaxID=30640 RepID=UPI001FB3CA14|nr:putative uncharacterized protein MSANTD5 [Sciurus carolinensis]
MEKILLQGEISRNTQKRKENQKSGKRSVPLIKPWSSHEIWSFLQEWEFLEHEVYYGVKNNLVISRAISQRLYQRGIKKSWKKCSHMLTSLEDLYWTIREANEKPRSEPLPCPYGEALHRILGHRQKDIDLSGPLCKYAAADLLPPEYQPKDCSISIFLEEPLWVPPYVIFVEDPQVPGWESWNMDPAWTIPYMLPAIFPGELHPATDQYASINW